jgi:hypothetical protein
MHQLTFDQIQQEAEAFAKKYRSTRDVPPLPSDQELQKYRKMLHAQYDQVVSLVKEHLATVESVGGHGYEHLEDVALRAVLIAEKECTEKNIDGAHQKLIIIATLLAGFLHDIERHLGFGEDHMIEGAKIAVDILQKSNIDRAVTDVVATVVRNHDHMDFRPENNSNPDMEIVYGCVFDADHFRYGLEREDTFWQMKAKRGATPQEVIHDYQFLPAYAHAWKSAYGKKVGPLYIEFGLAIAKHVENVFTEDEL